MYIFAVQKKHNPLNFYKVKYSKNVKTREFLINDELPYENSEMVRIIGNDFESKVVTFAEAKKIANSLEMDIIQINTNSKPNIVRIDSYDKFIYHMKKTQKKNKPTIKPLKEIDLKVQIASNDLATKVRKAKEFIEDGSKVKVVLTIRGREMSRRKESERCLYEFIDMMEDVATLEAAPKSEGNKTIVIFKHK